VQQVLALPACALPDCIPWEACSFTQYSASASCLFFVVYAYGRLNTALVQALLLLKVVCACLVDFEMSLREGTYGLILPTS